MIAREIGAYQGRLIGEFLRWVDSWERVDPRIPLISLLRAVDLAAFKNWTLDQTLRYDGEVPSAADGWRLALAPFVVRASALLATDGTPLFVSDEGIERSAAAVLSLCSTIQILSRAALIAEAKDSSSSAAASAVPVVELHRGLAMDTRALTTAWEWRDDEFHLRRMAIDQHRSKLQRLELRRPRVLALMRARSAPFHVHFPSYSTTPFIDEWYFELGRLFVSRMPQFATLPLDEPFGGVPLRHYVSVVADQVGYSLKHLDHCVLLRERWPELRMANVLTVTQDRSDALATVCELYGLRGEEAEQVLDTISLTPDPAFDGVEHVSAAFARNGRVAAMPLFVRSSANQHLRTLVGALGEPLRYLVESLQRRFPEDWSRAASARRATLGGLLADTLSSGRMAGDCVIASEDGVALRVELVQHDRGSPGTGADYVRVCLLEEGRREADSRTAERERCVELPVTRLIRTALHARDGEGALRRIWEEVEGTRAQLRPESLPLTIRLPAPSAEDIVLWPTAVVRAPSVVDGGETSGELVALERAIARERGVLTRCMAGVDAMYLVAELVRSVDGRISSLSPPSPASPVAGYQPSDDLAAGGSEVALRLAFGYPKALALSAPLPRGGVWPPREPPPVVSDDWGGAMALAAARLTEGEQVLALVRTGLGKVSLSSPGHLTVDLLPAALESERAERAHWEEFLLRLSEARKETWSQLEEAEQGISRRMGRYVRLSERGELHLRLPPSVRRHVFAKAFHSLDTKLGTDSFPGDATFGGVKFREYGNCLLLLAAEALIRLSAADALARANPALPAGRGRTTGWRVAGLAQLLASAPGARLEACHQAVRDLTLGPDEAEAYGRLPRAPLPPLIRTAPDHVLMSVAGCLDEPFQFLLWRLRDRYTSDWDHAVDEREQTFRSELYESLTSTMQDRFVTLPRGVNIRERGRVVTDIDAVILDKATGDLGLFQLKWQDPFGASLTRRASSAKNFVRAAERWVAAVSEWVAGRGTEDVAAALGIPRREGRAVQPRLFVLGRLAAHFSEFQAPDTRAAWGTWPQVMNLVARTHDSADGRWDAAHSPLAWLESRLRAESPMNRQEAAPARTEQLLIGGLRLTVRRPASNGAATDS